MKILIPISILVGLLAAFASEFIGFWAIIGAIISIVGFSLYARQQILWKGDSPHPHRLVHVDTQMAVRPTILLNTPPEGYRLACLFFKSGLIDRTKILDHGFDYKILDSIPPISTPATKFKTLCDNRAQDIVNHARANNLYIHLLWSGGIDSTTACVALLKALGNNTDPLTVYFNKESVREYPLFYKTFLNGKIKTERFTQMAAAFQHDALVVTGELGDQIFGSAKALEVSNLHHNHKKPLDIPLILRQPWQDGLAVMLEDQLASKHRAHLVHDYLSPQIDAAPVHIDDLFTCLWWMNFSLKWQPVSLRMMNLSGFKSLPAFQHHTAHFFQTTEFQQWAMVHAGKGVREEWSSYKWAARDYIANFTHDMRYHEEKQKLPSLRGLMPSPIKNVAFAIDAQGTILYQPRDHSLRTPTRAEKDNSSGYSFEYHVEKPLWDNLSDGE